MGRGAGKVICLSSLISLEINQFFTVKSVLPTIVPGKRSVNVLCAFNLTHKLILSPSPANGQGHLTKNNQLTEQVQFVKGKPKLLTALQGSMDVMEAFYQCFQNPESAGVPEGSGNGSVSNSVK